MKITSEQEMLDFGRDFARQLTAPAAIELVGDVGAGKTTFVRGLANGLGIKESITSPSFTISKSYAFRNGTLMHYDFYRLPDPGLMSDDLAENLADRHHIVVVEWADSVQNLLPAERITIHFSYLDDGAREVVVENPVRS